MTHVNWLAGRVIVHDYPRQRGAAERVVLSLCRTFPEAPVYAPVQDPATSFKNFATGHVLAGKHAHDPRRSRRNRASSHAARGACQPIRASRTP